MYILNDKKYKSNFIRTTLICVDSCKMLHLLSEVIRLPRYNEFGTRTFEHMSTLGQITINILLYITILTSSGAGCICDYTNTKSPLYTLYTLEWCTLSGYMVYTFEKCLEKKTFIPTPKYKYTWHEWNVQKAQLHIPTDLCLKFKMKTPSGYGAISRKRFGAKKNVFHPKST